MLFDLDGVISDASNRQHLLRGSSPDWRGFFTSAFQDPPIKAGLALAASVVDDCSVAILTARPGYATDITRQWIATHEVRHEPADPATPFRSGKPRPFCRLQAPGTGTPMRHGLSGHLCHRRRPDMNISMYRSEGVTALYVHSGYYEH